MVEYIKEEMVVVGNKENKRVVESKKAKIVAFEGIDASGKGTQFRLLVEALRKKGFKVLSLDVPQYNEFFGKEIGYLLSGEGEVDATTVRPKEMSLWYALDRFHAFKGVCLEDYDVILMNRSTYSNIGYQTTRVSEGEREDFIQWLMDVEFTHLEIPVPDKVFFLDVSSDVSQSNVTKKGTRDYVGDKADVYEDSSSMLNDARSVYLYLADKLDNFSLVNCMSEDKNMMRDIESIHEEVLFEVLSLLKVDEDK